MAHSSNDRIAIDFIDPLFAVVFHISFVQIYEQQWFWHPTLIFAELNFFNVATLALAYTTVILSWIGYHLSMKTRWIDVQNASGKWRFFFDVLLLFAYFILLVSYEHFKRELWMLAFVYFVFFLWDQMKRLEWKDEEQLVSVEERRKSVARRGVTVFWFVFFLALAVLYQIHPPKESFPCQDLIVLIAAFSGTWLYRLHKQKLWWQKTLLVLGFPKGNV